MNEFDEDCIDDSILSDVCLPTGVEFPAEALLTDLKDERQRIQELFQVGKKEDDPIPSQVAAEKELAKEEDRLLESPMVIYSLMGQNQGLSLPQLLAYWNVVRDEAAKKKRIYRERIHEICKNWSQLKLDTTEAKQKIQRIFETTKVSGKSFVSPPPLPIEKLSFMHSTNKNVIPPVALDGAKKTRLEGSLFTLCQPEQWSDMLIPFERMQSIFNWVKKIFDKDPPTIGIGIVHGRNGIGKKQALSLILKPFHLDLFSIFFSQEEKPEVLFLDRLSHQVSRSKRCFIIADCDSDDGNEAKKLNIIWQAILAEKVRAKNGGLATSQLFLFVCNSPFHGVLNNIRKQKFVKVWNVYPKPVKDFKKFYSTLRYKLRKASYEPFLEGTLPTQLPPLHPLTLVCEKQDVRRLIIQMEFLYRTMSGAILSLEGKRDSTCRVPLSNFDCTLIALTHQMPPSLKNLPSLAGFSHYTPTVLLRQIFSFSVRSLKEEDAKDKKTPVQSHSNTTDHSNGQSNVMEWVQWEGRPQMVKLVDQHSRETTPLMISHNITPLALGFHNVSSMNQTWVRLFSEDAETLAEKDFASDWKECVIYGGAGKEKIDQSIYSLYKTLGSYFPYDNKLPNAEEWLINSCLQVSPIGTRTRYDKFNSFTLTYPSLTKEIVSKKFDLIKKKERWLKKRDWRPSDGAHLFSKSDEELFILYGHEIQQFTDMDEEPDFIDHTKEEKKKKKKRKVPSVGVTTTPISTDEKPELDEVPAANQENTSASPETARADVKNRHTQPKSLNAKEKRKERTPKGSKTKSVPKPKKPKEKKSGGKKAGKIADSKTKKKAKNAKEQKEKKPRKPRKDKGIKRGKKKKKEGPDQEASGEIKEDNRTPPAKKTKLSADEHEQKLSFSVLKKPGYQPIAEKKKNKRKEVSVQKTKITDLWQTKAPSEEERKESASVNVTLEESSLQVEQDAPTKLKAKPLSEGTEEVNDQLPTRPKKRIRKVIICEDETI
jgi:hypothetical protein